MAPKGILNTHLIDNNDNRSSVSLYVPDAGNEKKSMSQIGAILLPIRDTGHC